jgi:hypothetical protein
MKQLLITLGLIAVVFLGIKAYSPKPETAIGGSGIQFTYESPAIATSSVGIYSWATVLAANNSHAYRTFCNNADGGVNANNPVYLGFGATSTDPYGFRLASGECYEMTLDKMFWGTVYAIASTSTTTVLTITK